MYSVGVGINDRWQWLWSTVRPRFRDRSHINRIPWSCAVWPPALIDSRRPRPPGRDVTAPINTRPARAWPGSRDFQETRPSDLISTVLGRPLIYRLSVLSILLYAWSNIDAALVFGSAMHCSLVYWHMADPWLNIHVHLSLLSISVFFYFLVFFSFFHFLAVGSVR